MSHDAVLVEELGYEVDQQIVELVRLLNRIPGVHTTSSCQGNPGVIGPPDEGFYGYGAPVETL